MAVSKRLRFEILRRDNHTCQSCGAKAPDVELVVDHVVPVALGGSDHPSNLRTLCDPCNSGKSATPPDAAVVQKVSEDAIRWSAAMQAAADAMLADREATQAHRDAFEQSWERYYWGPANAPQYAPLPAGWGVSIDRIIAAGLPPAILEDCIDAAFANTKVAQANKFKYTCGVAWRNVNKLQDAAKAAASPASDAAVDPEDEDYEADFDPRLQAGRESLAHDLLTWFRMEEIDYFLAEAKEAYEEIYEGEPEPAVITIRAGEAAMSQSRRDVTNLLRAVDGLFELFSVDEIEAAMGEAAASLPDRVRSKPGGLRNARFKQLIAERLIVAHGRSLLETMSPEERAEYIDYAVAWHGPVNPFDDEAELSEDKKIRYAAYCARVISGKRTFLNMCISRGTHIERCPSRAEFKPYFNELDCCVSAECDEGPRHGFCRQHMEDAMEHGHTMRSGQFVTVRDFKEFTQ